MPGKQLTIALVLFGSVVLAACARPGWTVLEQRTSTLNPKQILDARRQFHIEVLAFDTSKRYGTAFPYSDHVRLRVTNDSDVTLPYITPLVKRYSGGNAVGWSRSPVIAVHDLAPKQSKTIDYYPHGHLSIVPVDRLTVEIEQTIDEDEMRLFKEVAL